LCPQFGQKVVKHKVSYYNWKKNMYSVVNKVNIQEVT
jgi:hypothetical protein